MMSIKNGSVPISRKLQAYAFDPSLSLSTDTSDLNSVIYKVKWEDALEPGPKGEYIHVIDYDPTIRRKDDKYGVFYRPVDLNEQFILANDGLNPDENDPRFHQQMVYAVAMKTIANFEKALGRKILWSERKKGSYSERFVRQLVIYPHALREPNAFYSPTKKALLFGYFKSRPSEKHLHMPNSWVFTCLSHDIIAHEITHAILDGINPYYNEPTNPDVLAFHEAFADIVALFQHFTMPEVLRSQIARTKGNLEEQNLLGQLAQEFGSAIGGYGSLRDAIGSIDPKTKKWKRTIPDPSEYETVLSPHARGSILVAAVFDAFLTLYKNRVSDLMRIASGGSGILPQGELHPDLVNRLAQEAAKTAQHVLNMCIRALDYCPPVDLTFGEYLRAIITADCDLVADDSKNYRLAFIDSFKRRGIYPKGLSTLSIESLRYPLMANTQKFKSIVGPLTHFLKEYARKMMFQTDREKIFSVTKSHITGQNGQPGLHRELYFQGRKNPIFENLTGILFSKEFQQLGINPSNTSDGEEFPSFYVRNLRVINRVGPTGKKINHILFTIVQTAYLNLDSDSDSGVVPSERKEGETADIIFRGGATMIFDLDKREFRYTISKPIFDSKEHKKLDMNRLNAQIDFQYDPDMKGMTELEKYFGLHRHTHLSEPFALLHNH